MGAQLVKNALLVASVLVASPCLPGDVLTGAKPVPTASATLHGATVDMPRGSYCWSSGGHGECADSAAPEALLRTDYLKPYRTAGGFDVKISFHSATQPSTFNVQLFQSPDSKVGPVKESSTHAFSLGASPPAASGIYVYVVTGTWPEGDVGFFLALDLIPGVA
ncbi:MAG: hypothetical protein ACXVBY_12860 [Isosphaeraceae bacterium]